MEVLVPLVVTGWVGDGSLVALDLDDDGGLVEYLGRFAGERTVV
jgi:hypothetical protein